MTDLQQHLLQLLSEIDIMCDELSIPYALFGNSAQQACERGKFEGTCYELHVMAPARELPTLKRALLALELPHRAIEDLSSNPKLDANVMRYVDTSTTLYDREDYVRYDLLGAAVTIHPLFGDEPSPIAKALTQSFLFLNGGGEYSPYMLSKPKQWGMRFGRAVISAFGEALPAKVLYSLIERDGGIGGKKSCYYESHVGFTKKYPIRFIEKTKRMSFAGVHVNVPSDLEGYLKNHYTADWSSKYTKPTKKSVRIAMLCDASTPFEETIAYLAEDGFDLREFQEEQFEHFRWHNERFLYWGAMVNYEYSAAKMSRDRIDLYVELRGKRDELRRACSEDDFDALEALLADYLLATETYYEKNLGFYIDRELFEAASKVWRHRGAAGFADEVYALVADAHKNGDLAATLAPYL